MDNEDEERGRRTTMENPRKGRLSPGENPPNQGFHIEQQTDNCETLHLDNDGWLELGNHTPNVDDGQRSPCGDDVVDDGQLSPLHQGVVDDHGQLNPLCEDVVDHVPRTQFPLGRPLLEVFSVHIMNKHGESGDHIYGEILVFDDDFFRCPRYIYKQNRNNSKSISPGDILLLTGPTRSIEAYDIFIFDVALTYEYSNRLLDDEVISRQITWTFHDRDRRYNTLLFEEIGGLFSSVIVHYVVFKNAVEATLEVTLINRDEENPAKLCGTMTAHNSNFMAESVESLLFREAWNEGIIVRLGQLIPLSRSLVVVPLNSSLIVEANMWDSCNDNEIADGIVEFPAQSYGTSERNIYGEYGEIRVKVTWD